MFLLKPMQAVKANHLGTEQNDSRLVKSLNAYHILSVSHLSSTKASGLYSEMSVKGKVLAAVMLGILGLLGHISEMSVENVFKRVQH